MAVVNFFGKPTCRGNRRQREILESSGHTIVFHNILEQPWTEKTLAPFLGMLPPKEWFNRAAVRVKSGEVIPDELTASQAMHLILEDHALLRRPLLESEDIRQVGWNPEAVDKWLGLRPDQDHGSEACAHPKHKNIA
ncbi:MAG: ArsC/Spx/MgsR family protein [Zymomonas mobilis subsp. pomaceae]